MSGPIIWRQPQPSSFELSVRSTGTRETPETAVVLRTPQPFTETEIHLSWADTWTLAYALEEWLHRFGPRPPHDLPPAPPGQDSTP